jgi:hypothetical protein
VRPRERYKGLAVFGQKPLQWCTVSIETCVALKPATCAAHKRQRQNETGRGRNSKKRTEVETETLVLAEADR